jgi:hypothetical protein
MLNEIEKYTSRFKLGLIKLGHPLPPASPMYSNKIKQIDLDFKHIYSEIIGQTTEKPLFELASQVILTTTGTYYHIQHLKDLLTAIKRTCLYIETY